MTEQDQPRLDLDAAIDAVVPSLTAVTDEAAAASLRRTRTALADDARAGRGAWPWRLAAAAVVAVVLVVVAMWSRLAQPAREIAATPRPAAPVAPAPLASSPAPPLERVASATPAPRVRPRPAQRVRATSAPASEPARRRDPLADFVRAVQAIPEDAWARGTVQADVSVNEIAIAPLEVPAIPDAPGEPIAPGEP